MTITTNPAMVQGKIRAENSETGVFRMVRPSSRRSSMTVSPKNTQSVKTWTDSTIGYPQMDSWSATLQGVASSHWQNSSRDTYLAPLLMLPGKFSERAKANPMFPDHGHYSASRYSQA